MAACRPDIRRVCLHFFREGPNVGLTWGRPTMQDSVYEKRFQCQGWWYKVVQKVVNRLPGPQEGVGVARKHAPGGSRVGRAPCRSSGSKSATDCVPRCRRTRSPSQDCADGHDTMADAASRVAHSTRIRKWSTRTASCTPAIDARSGVCGQLLSLPGSRPCCGRLSRQLFAYVDYLFSAGCATYAIEPPHGSHA